MTALRQHGELATVRRLEAAGFRAWPASAVAYDGAWLIRLTPDLPHDRLNSVNPLDPGDAGGIQERVARAADRFEASGRAVTFRMSPLAGPQLAAYLDRNGWTRFSESIVMRLPLREEPAHAVMHQIPMRDPERFMRSAARVKPELAGLRAGLVRLIKAIEPEAGLFTIEAGSEPVASGICVHDGDLAGLFEIATLERARRQGHGRRLVLSALQWARLRGAREAWLQVEADNEAALALYAGLGFEEVYRYHYRRPPGA